MSVTFQPGPVCVLVGLDRAGRSAREDAGIGNQELSDEAAIESSGIERLLELGSGGGGPGRHRPSHPVLDHPAHREHPRGTLAVLPEQPRPSDGPTKPGEIRPAGRRAELNDGGT